MTGGCGEVSWQGPPEGFQQAQSPLVGLMCPGYAPYAGIATMGRGSGLWGAHSGRGSPVLPSMVGLSLGAPCSKASQAGCA